MSSPKYIVGAAYATSGYTLSGAYQTVVIEKTGAVGGTGLAAGTGESYTIGNYGSISGSTTGLHLYGAGDVFNLGTSASIVGYDFGVRVGGSGSVVNSGTIEATRTTYGDGVALLASGSLFNSGPAGLVAGYIGVYGRKTITVVNSGQILATNTGSAVIRTTSSGKIANSGTIRDAAGGADGIYIGGGVVTNATHGTIYGGGSGVVMIGAASISNAGLITGDGGSGFGVLITGKGTIKNSGTILEPGSGREAVELRAGGPISNIGVASLIEGYGHGVYLIGTGQISNAGSIISTALFGSAISVYSAPGTINNKGTIYGMGEFGYGVTLQSGGSVTNAGTASLIEGATGVAGATKVVNSGTIETLSGSDFCAVKLSSGSVMNTGAGSLLTGYIGIEATGAATIINTGQIRGIGTAIACETVSKITNSGTIDSTGTNIGVLLQGGGTITNKASGLIEGQSGIEATSAGVAVNAGVITASTGEGVFFDAGAGKLTNTGTILTSGSSGTGVELEDGGSATNSGKASLIEGYSGVYLTALAQISNSGAILATGTAGNAIEGRFAADSIFNSGTIHAMGSNGDGIVLQAGGAVTNKGTASLIQGDYGVMLAGAGKVSNYGTIESTGGSGGTAVAFSSSSDVLVDEAGSTIVGQVVGGGGMLDLAGAGGTLTGLGSIMTGFARVNVLAGASWTFGGAHSFAPMIANSGTLTITSGMLEVKGSMIGTGTDGIGGGATLKVDSGVAATQTIAFAETTGGDLILSDALGRALRFQGTVSGFGGADEIDLSTFQFSGEPTTTWSQNGARGVLTVTDGVKAAKIALFGQYNAAGFTVAADSGTGTAITYSPPPSIMALPHS